MAEELINLIKKPKNYSTWLCLFLVSIISAHSSRSENLKDILSYTILFIVAELLIRTSQFIEYYFTFYGKINNYYKPLKDIFQWENVTLVSCALITFGYVLLYPPETDIHNRLALLIGYTLVRACNFSNSRYIKKLWIENSDGLDYGSGMAYSFFYGYLNIILPNKGDSNLSIKELMERYEATENISIAKHKLFLLIDKNLYITPDLSQMSNKGALKMESCKNMLEINRSRAGIKNRSYKNTVYKITQNDGSDPYFLVAEGATPLLTLYETMKSKGEDHQNQDSNIDEIISQFYRTLEKLLKDYVDCTDLCELVYFNSNETKDVGELLLERIKRIE